MHGRWTFNDLPLYLLPIVNFWTRKELTILDTILYSHNLIDSLIQAFFSDNLLILSVRCGLRILYFYFCNFLLTIISIFISVSIFISISISVFDDGDERTLGRNSVCPQGAKHFNEEWVGFSCQIPFLVWNAFLQISIVRYAFVFKYCTVLSFIICCVTIIFITRYFILVAHSSLLSRSVFEYSV